MEDECRILVSFEDAASPLICGGEAGAFQAYEVVPLPGFQQRGKHVLALSSVLRIITFGP